MHAPPPPHVAGVVEGVDHIEGSGGVATDLTPLDVFVRCWNGEVGLACDAD